MEHFRFACRTYAQHPYSTLFYVCRQEACILGDNLFYQKPTHHKMQACGTCSSRRFLKMEQVTKQTRLDLSTKLRFLWISHRKQGQDTDVKVRGETHSHALRSNILPRLSQREEECAHKTPWNESHKIQTGDKKLVIRNLEPCKCNRKLR